MSITKVLDNHYRITFLICIMNGSDICIFGGLLRQVSKERKCCLGSFALLCNYICYSLMGHHIVHEQITHTMYHAAVHYVNNIPAPRGFLFCTQKFEYTVKSGFKVRGNNLLADFSKRHIRIIFHLCCLLGCVLR